MKLSRASPLLLVTLCCLVSKSEVNGCSVVMGYVRPTNYELVKQADAIVIANATTFEKEGKTLENTHFGIFKFKVLERIKGNCDTPVISVEGDDALRSWEDPNDFAFTKGDHGPCNPTDYKLNGDYVLFLDNWKGQWIVGGPPFTRVNVLIEETNAPWAKAVRQYARVATLNDYAKEKEALRVLQAKAATGDPEIPAALVADIDNHFKRPTPSKSFSDLQALYQQNDVHENREQVLWACVRGSKPEAADLFRGLLRSGQWTNYLVPVCSYAAKLHLSGFHDLLVSKLKTAHNEHERRMLLLALTGSAGESEQALMQKVMRAVNEEELEIVARWFTNHPSTEAIHYVSQVAGRDYSKNFQLTLTLAAMGDTNVVSWARDYVKRRSEGVWLGYYVFAQSPLPEADRLARAAIKRGDAEALVALVQGYEDSTRKDRFERIQEVVATKPKDRKLVYWLRRTLGNWADDGDKMAEALLNQLPTVEDPP